MIDNTTRAKTSESSLVTFDTRMGTTTRLRDAVVADSDPHRGSADHLQA
ncbi:MAG: hypothetical protein QOJ78_754, partial [Pseudonocardiales bacterium]|nr:hypothetical protein [Pseudonocardiales bacterium]